MGHQFLKSYSRNKKKSTIVSQFWRYYVPCVAMNSVTLMFMLGVAATASASPLATRSDNGKFSPGEDFSWRSDNGKFSPGEDFSWRSDNGKSSPGEDFSWRSDNG